MNGEGGIRTHGALADTLVEETRVRQASLLKGMAMSKAQYERARIRREMIQTHINDVNRYQQGDD